MNEILACATENIMDRMDKWTWFRNVIRGMELESIKNFYLEAFSVLTIDKVKAQK